MFYAAKTLTNDSPPHVGYVTRFRARRGGIGGAILLVIGLAFYGVVFHLLWNMLLTPAHGDEFSPCQINGRAVPCQHFLSSNPDEMRVRDEWLRLQVPRDERREDRKDDHK